MFLSLVYEEYLLVLFCFVKKVAFVLIINAECIFSNKIKKVLSTRKRLSKIIENHEKYKINNPLKINILVVNHFRKWSITEFSFFHIFPFYEEHLDFKLILFIENT